MTIKTFGIASGIGAGRYGAQLGVWDLYYKLNSELPNLSFNKIFYEQTNKNKLDAIPILANFFTNIQKDFARDFVAEDKYLFLTGDHSNAIATWSCLSNNLKSDIGLIWVDAHLDSHTPQTTPSKNVHGMPLATLMGYGDKSLTSLINNKLKPQNIVFIGTRDYEEAEIELLNSLGVKIYHMSDICRNNINNVFEEAKNYLISKVDYFGVSLDIDSMDPSQMPATGCYNPGGLLLQDVVFNLGEIAKDKKFICLEITEFNPLLDINSKTHNGILEVISSVFSKK